MKRDISQTSYFEKAIGQLIKKGLILQTDFDNFQRDLAENPKGGKVIPDTGGIRKARLKSSTGGKSGGFRVCYIDLESRMVLFLIYIYAKNEKDDITAEDKKTLKNLVKTLKEVKK